MNKILKFTVAVGPSFLVCRTVRADIRYRGTQGLLECRKKCQRPQNGFIDSVLC